MCFTNNISLLGENVEDNNLFVKVYINVFWENMNNYMRQNG